MTTVFIRAIEADVDDKAAVLREAINAHHKAAGTTRFEVDPATFSVIPRSPFAYWTSHALREAFTAFGSFESENRIARRGPSTCDDFRYLRCSWETPFLRSHGLGRWMDFAKGGAFSRFYADVHLVVDWEAERNTFSGFFGRPGRWIERPESVDHFFRSGLTWPLRTTSGLSLRAMPTGCIFGHKGPAAFVDGDDTGELLALCGLMNSSAFAALVGLQLAAADAAARSYEVGVIQRTPVPDLSSGNRQVLAKLARRAWSLKRNLDTRAETSHAFTLPALLQVDGRTLGERVEAWLARVAEVEAELADLQAQIDDRCFALYGIDDVERERIEQGFAGVGDDARPDEDDNSDDAEDEEIDIEPMAASLLSWALGVAFGRFDVRLATGARALPAEPEPFDPLPICSPGMLTGEDGLPLATAPKGYPLAYPTDGVLVDDPGHAQDLMGRVRAVFEVVFGEHASERLLEAESHLGRRNEDLRAWFVKRFFATHVKRYSKSRRKAPIYWQLGTPSGSYSVWCYCHRLSGDTLFRLTQEYVTPKVAHEEGKLNTLRQEAGADPSSKQCKAIDAQESFVAELRAFTDEVERVAPLWDPNLDDGVVINFAPLWRLVPHDKPWQRQCKEIWDKLQQGDYDWSHLAMHLWPERVIPKCAVDRSLAIAHGLGAELWFEDEEGKWQPRKVGSEQIGKLMTTRSSSAVKAALSSLLSAPVQSGGAKHRSRRRGGA